MKGDVQRSHLRLFKKPGATLRSEFRVGGVSVQLAGQRSDVHLTAALEPFRVGTPTPDIKIQVEWAESLHPQAKQEVFDSGSVWRLYEDGAGFQFDFSAPLLLGERPYKRLLVDHHFCRATLQMNEESFSRLPHVAEPLEYPLDELLIMHRLTQEKAIELHSCGIVRADGTGNLFVGHSGAGKSTTTRLWTAREDVQVLSDDRIIVRRDEEGAAEAEAPFAAAGVVSKHRVPPTSSGQALRLRDWCASRTNHSAQDDKAKKQVPPLRAAQGWNDNPKYKIRMYGTPWHGEARYASPASALLARIFILEHGHGNVLTRLTPSQAVAELFARSFVPFHRHEYVDSALAFLEEVVDTVPCYRYAFEPNESAVERILNFHD